MFPGASEALATGAKDADAVSWFMIKKAKGELAEAMAYTGCTVLSKMDPTVIHSIRR
ncbi:MAG: hypothetical protein IKP86_09270 [Anaerolineaceae bacterium]|nr:hypothetical protein [Anaerolineaceae bacterium]